MKKSYLLLLALFWLPSVYVYSLDVILTKARMQIQCNIVSQDENTVTYQLLDSQDTELYTMEKADISKVSLGDLVNYEKLIKSVILSYENSIKMYDGSIKTDNIEYQKYERLNKIYKKILVESEKRILETWEK